jgi:S1-C subfamily serine protease
MFKRYETLPYILLFLAVLIFLIGWKLRAGLESPEDSAEYLRRINITAENIRTFGASDDPNDALRIYGVNVVHTPPFEKRFFGYGIYLGDGLVITAAHVVGSLPRLYSPLHILIAGQDLPATVLKQGSFDHIDLALLSIDQERLPVSLRLRRTPLCKDPLRVGTNVTVVYPERTVRSQVISPRLVQPQYRSKYPTLITEPQGSGSGVFNPERKCLIGIMSAQVPKFAYQNDGRGISFKENGLAGYFVPVANGFIAVH